MPSSALLPWSEFALCALLIGVAGSQLSRYGDIIAEKTGLGATWIGVLLMATVTSRPHLPHGGLGQPGSADDLSAQRILPLPVPRLTAFAASCDGFRRIARLTPARTPAL
jgi:hypothetical protein